VTYRVTADNGSVRDYTVTVRRRVSKGLEITFASLPYETVDLSANSQNDLSRTQKDTLRITVTGTSARWFIDGNEQSETGAALNIAAIDCPIGTHHVAALVYKGGIPYSNELTFNVVK
jgi:hypothetical protein